MRCTRHQRRRRPTRSSDGPGGRTRLTAPVGYARADQAVSVACLNQRHVVAREHCWQGRVVSKPTQRIDHDDVSGAIKQGNGDLRRIMPHAVENAIDDGGMSPDRM